MSERTPTPLEVLLGRIAATLDRIELNTRPVAFTLHTRTPESED